jgi:hypothetical protein
MRFLGFSLVIVGFLWVAWDCADGFVGYQHTRWIWQTQHLPAGEDIKRSDAAGAMRELSLDLKNRHREILLPAVLMLVGGLILGFRGRVIAEQTRCSEPGGDAAVSSRDQQRRVADLGRYAPRMP